MKENYLVLKISDLGNRILLGVACSATMLFARCESANAIVFSITVPITDRGPGFVPAASENCVVYCDPAGLNGRVPRYAWTIGKVKCPRGEYCDRNNPAAPFRDPKNEVEGRSCGYEDWKKSDVGIFGFCGKRFYPPRYATGRK